MPIFEPDYKPQDSPYARLEKRRYTEGVLDRLFPKYSTPQQSSPVAPGFPQPGIAFGPQTGQERLGLLMGAKIARDADARREGMAFDRATQFGLEDVRQRGGLDLERLRQEGSAGQESRQQRGAINLEELRQRGSAAEQGRELDFRAGAAKQAAQVSASSLQADQEGRKTDAILKFIATGVPPAQAQMAVSSGNFGAISMPDQPKKYEFRTANEYDPLTGKVARQRLFGLDPATAKTFPVQIPGGKYSILDEIEAGNIDGNNLNPEQEAMVRAELAEKESSEQAQPKRGLFGRFLNYITGN